MTEVFLNPLEYKEDFSDIVAEMRKQGFSLLKTEGPSHQLYKERPFYGYRLVFDNCQVKKRQLVNA